MHALELLRAIAAGEVYAGATFIVRRHVLQDFCLFTPHHVLRNRGDVSISLGAAELKLHQAVWLGVGERLQQNCVYDGEDGGVRADAQGQRGDRRSREAGTAAQHAKRVTYVLQQVFEKLRVAHLELLVPAQCALTAGRSPARHWLAIHNPPIG